MYPQETPVTEQTINADKQILRNTDYNMLKAFEHILQADSIDELMIRIQYVRDQYQDVLTLRQDCRDEVNVMEAIQASEEETIQPPDEDMPIPPILDGVIDDGFFQNPDDSPIPPILDGVIDDGFFQNPDFTIDDGVIDEGFSQNPDFTIHDGIDADKFLQ